MNRRARSWMEKKEVDWTQLPDDVVIQVFSILNYHDRANLSATCKTWRLLSEASCLWESLDLRAHEFGAAMASSLSRRCQNLKKLKFSGVESADAIINLRARNLREISGHYCQEITNSTLCVIVARHEALESLQLGHDTCQNISSDAIKQISLCCLKLKKLRLSGVPSIGSDAINSLATHCKNLTELAFLDCMIVDERALGNMVSLLYLSVAGTTDIDWTLVPQSWSNLPNLIGLDVSRSSIDPTVVPKLLSSSQSLQVMCAFNCCDLKKDDKFGGSNTKGKLLLTDFTDLLNVVPAFNADAVKQGRNACSGERNAFAEWRNSKESVKNVDEILNWLEWTLSDSLLRIGEEKQRKYWQPLDTVWLKQGGYLFLNLMQSIQEDVQEKAVKGLATLGATNTELTTLDGSVAEVVMPYGGIVELLNLTASSHEWLQAEAIEALANLSRDRKFAKAIAEGGGISLLVGLTKSVNRLVAEKAAGGLFSLSFHDEHYDAISKAGGIKALLDLITKCSLGVSERLLGSATEALSNLLRNENCRVEFTLAGGIHALVVLVRNCNFESVQTEAARALGSLSLHDGNNELIGAEGGIEAVVALAQSYSNDLFQISVTSALLGLSVWDANCISIVRNGGIAPLIALALSDSDYVCWTAVAALANIASDPTNALRIIEEGGVAPIANICSSSEFNGARLMAATTLMKMFDERIDE